ncbi:hypothetical protein NCS57_00348600 [Fusarium keratoplasticum]|uniref:Uncharacterized protein n=1 Tax=Fusarium keratoplasticum TaxID=1328300 RepID=A0ACC0R4L0_9HYPO|nr:hypothetical protein NCS57_00348600 [Fusarium keratoplasticum]KAI8674507.1 hypothetical protein NCS57_00348600 [Fusarium keratoplasticum]
MELACPICKSGFPTTDDLEAHSQKYQSRLWAAIQRCLQSQKYVPPEFLELLQCLLHLPDIVLSCPECDFTPKDLDKHWMTHVDCYVKCEFCKRDQTKVSKALTHPKSCPIRQGAELSSDEKVDRQRLRDHAAQQLDQKLNPTQRFAKRRRVEKVWPDLSTSTMIPPLPAQSIPSEDVEGGFFSPHASVPNTFPTDTSARLSQHQDSSQFNQAPALDDYPYDIFAGFPQHQDSSQFDQAPALDDYPYDIFAGFPQHQDSSQFDQAPALDDYPYDIFAGFPQHQDSSQFDQAPALDDYPYDIFAGFPQHHVPAQFDQPPALENCPANRATRPQYPSSSRVD